MAESDERWGEPRLTVAESAPRPQVVDRGPDARPRSRRSATCWCAPSGPTRTRRSPTTTGSTPSAGQHFVARCRRQDRRPRVRRRAHAPRRRPGAPDGLRRGRRRRHPTARAPASARSSWSRRTPASATGSSSGPSGPGRQRFYERLGWRTWTGPTAVARPRACARTPDEDGYIMVLTTPTSPPLDLDATIMLRLAPRRCLVTLRSA